MTGGVHRQAVEAGPLQCIDALNVTNEGGDLRRRDAFHAIYTGAPFYLPAGSCYIYESGAPNIFHYDRQLSLASVGSGGSILHIACSDPFDGFELGPVITDAIGVNGDRFHAYFKISYWNGAAFVDAGEIVETVTAHIYDDDGQVWRKPLLKDGRVSWHRTNMPDWTAFTPTGARTGAVYVVRIDIYRVALDGFSGQAAIASEIGYSGDPYTLVAPGIRPFVLEPVRSLIPFTAQQGRPVVVVGSDRRVRRGRELGAQLGFFKGAYRETDNARLIPLSDPRFPEDRHFEGAGTMDKVDWAGIYRAAIGQAWPGGTWTLAHAASGSVGVAGYMTRNRDTTNTQNGFVWYEDALRGAALVQNIAPIAASMAQADGIGTFDFLRGAGSLTEVGDDLWRNCRIRCTAKGAGGTPVGETREIVSHTDALGNIRIRYHEVFSILPDTDNRFEISTPPMYLRLKPYPPRDEAAPGQAARQLDYEILSVSTDRVLPVTGRDFCPDYTLQTNHIEKPVHWEIHQFLPWVIDGGAYWSVAFDQVTRKLIMVNGNAALEYDGYSLRPLALLSDPEDPRVQTLVGSLATTSQTQLTPREIAGYHLRNAQPVGKIVVYFAGRVVMIGVKNRPYEIVYSATAPDTDIWPLGYNTRLLDSDNNEPSAAFVLAGKLYVATSTSIHAADAPGDDGHLYFRPVVHGRGFLSQRSIARLGDSKIVGVCADGVYVFDGFNLTPLVENWLDVLPFGVSAAKLKDSACAVSLQKNRAYVALAGARSSANDTVLDIDLTNGAVYPWAAPWGGITEVCRHYDENGKERMLFGTNDGHVAVLRKADTDDGASLEAYAETPPQGVAGLMTGRPMSIVVQTQEMGPAEEVTITARLNQGSDPLTEAVPMDKAISAPVSSFVVGTNALTNTSVNGVTALLHNGRLVTQKFPIAGPARAELLSMRIEGAHLWILRSVEAEFADQAEYRSPDG